MSKAFRLTALVAVLAVPATAFPQGQVVDGQQGPSRTSIESGSSQGVAAGWQYVRPRRRMLEASAAAIAGGLLAAIAATTFRR